MLRGTTRQQQIVAGFKDLVGQANAFQLSQGPSVHTNIHTTYVPPGGKSSSSDSGRRPGPLTDRSYRSDGTYQHRPDHPAHEHGHVDPEHKPNTVRIFVEGSQPALTDVISGQENREGEGAVRPTIDVGRAHPF